MCFVPVAAADVMLSGGGLRQGEIDGWSKNAVFSRLRAMCWCTAICDDDQVTEHSRATNKTLSRC